MFFFSNYFLQERRIIIRSVTDIHHQVSRITEGGWEILIMMHFVLLQKKHDKMKDFAKKQLDLINQQFQFYQEN